MKLKAGEWQVLNIPEHAECAGFLRRVHYAKGCPNTSTYRHGLYQHRPELEPFRGDLFGVALWIPPMRSVGEKLAGKDWGGVLALSRFAVAPDVPTNGASFLLGRSMKAIDRDRWPVLLTYADTGQGHTGAIYRATNWTCEGETPAGDTWLGPDGAQMGRKRGRFTYRADEMEALGFVRRPGLPKIRFVHRVLASQDQSM